MNALDILLSSNHIIHKSLCALCFWAVLYYKQGRCYLGRMGAPDYKHSQKRIKFFEKICTTTFKIYESIWDTLYESWPSNTKNLPLQKMSLRFLLVNNFTAETSDKLTP